MSSKKGQIWGLDLIVASLIFSFGILVLYLYAINNLNPSKQKVEDLMAAGNTISALLLSNEDYGLLSNNKINQTKLDEFDSLSDKQKKERLNVINNFYFSMKNMEVNGQPKEFVGIMNQTPIRDYIRITRITIYKNTPTKFELYVWK